MNINSIVISCILISTYITFSYSHKTSVNKYEPTWISLDSRAIPQWYDNAKFGIFIHWGVFSVPSFGSEWFWADWKSSKNNSYAEFMERNYKPSFTYQDFAAQFTAEFFNAEVWANILKTSGAKYVVLTSKHHEGFTLWPSKYSFSWNAMDVGPHRDLLGELATAIRSKTNLVFGVYHSLFEWFHPLYLKDKKSKFTGKEFVLGKTIPELVELVEKYKPEVIWSDGDWEAPDTYWNSKEFLAWLYNDSPVKDSVVVNDRWGSGIPCKHGGYFTCSDRYNPGVLQSHKWENCMTIDKKSWGYRRNALLKDYLTSHDLIKELVETVSCGGNLLMNIGPTKDGLIPIIFQERLYDIGKWLNVNGEAIYSSQPWTTQNDTYSPEVWYTRSGGNSVQVTVYAIFLRWPIDGYLTLEAPKFTANTTVNMLGYTKPLKWKLGDKAVTITLPDKAKTATDWAWVLTLMNLLS